MPRPVSSDLAVQKVLCADGVKRTFRFYSKKSTAGTVRVNGLQVTGDIRAHRYGGYIFVANPDGMNADALPETATTELIYSKIVELCTLVKEMGITEPDPMYIARFMGLEVNEEEGWIEAPLPKRYDELELGILPRD